jgi:site-specific recombinase XerC
LLRDRKLEPRTVKLHVSALRFFFVKTLKRPHLLDDIPYPKVPRRLPTILTVDEVTRLIDTARTLTESLPLVEQPATVSVSLGSMPAGHS